MGLDMYLTAHKYVSGWSHNPAPETALYRSLIKEVFGLDETPCVNSPSANVALKVGYWRKANAIHAWFVRECQDGKDECQETYVEREKLKELRELCAKVMADPSKANLLLPPQAGFFFGSTEIDEGYREDLESTVKQIDAALNNPAFEGCDFHYRASW